MSQEPTLNEKLDFLLGETEDLQARIVGLSAVISALVATHPDKAVLHDYLMRIRGALAKNPPEQIADPDQVDTALSVIDWLDRDLPPAG